MPQYFEKPEQTTFNALKFNGQYFYVGRGLFIHFMKYYPSIIEEQNRHSRSKTPFTLEEFAKATRAQKKWFKGLKLEYEAVDKKYREEIRTLSKVGEGWWPERKLLPRPGVDYEITYSNFLMNYEGPKYYRRLGKGMNIPNDQRVHFQTGVEFTRAGYKQAVKAYRKLVGKPVLFDLQLPYDDGFGYYCLKQMSSLAPIPELHPVDWLVWRIKNKTDREEFIQRVSRQIS